MLILEYQIAYDHAMVRVPRFLGSYGFSPEALAYPNLVHSEQRIVVRARGPPSASGFPECIEHSLAERGERIIGRRGIEITANDHITGPWDALDTLHDVRDFFAVFHSLITVINPESRHPKIDAEYRWCQAYANDIRLETSR